MITPEKKDALLHKLVKDDTMDTEFNIWEMSKELGMPKDMVDAILDQFEELGLCRISRCLGGHVMVSLNAKAHDMVFHGGFVAQEEYLRKNIEKLELELKSLEPAFTGKVETISNIIGNIASALGLFVKL